LKFNICGDFVILEDWHKQVIGHNLDEVNCLFLFVVHVHFGLSLVSYGEYVCIFTFMSFNMAINWMV